MRHLNGMHASNGGQYGVEQCLRACGGLGAWTCLHFQLVSDPVLGMSSEDENLNYYGKIRYGWQPQGIPPRPQLFIHIRVYHPNSLSVNPRTWAGHIVHLLSKWKGSRDHADKTANLWDDPFVGVSSGNELNLHYENGDPNGANQWMYQTVAHYEKIAAWDMAFWERVDELVPNRKALRVSPAFADGHEPANIAPDGEYTIPAVRAMLEASDLVGIHPYAILHEQPESGAIGKLAYWYMLRPFRPKGHKDISDPGGVISQYPHKRFLLTETGTFTHSDVHRTAETKANFIRLYNVASESGLVCGITPFIWNSDQAHPHNTIWNNEALWQWFETLPGYAAPDLPVRGVVPPEPVPPPVVEPPAMSNPYGYNVGSGFETRAAELGWTLLSDEIYHDPKDNAAVRSAFSEAFCDKGRLYWHAKTGVIATPFLAPSRLT
jgi:hypothetical protein